uniref:Protein HGH1 N-terminal domain-containing protein n=1 Tax=Timema poppense TaxID=170557 RepID=A0A7R9DP46_TIMPO|nr:unnamed protein product [Timema poppensis]
MSHGLNSYSLLIESVHREVSHRNVAAPDEHEWLLSPEVDLLSYVLLPLAGPEEFDEEDTNKLPPDLQYLPTDKQREPDPDIRMCLIETVNLVRPTAGQVFGDCETQTVGQVFGDCETQTVGLVFGDCETQTVGLVFGGCETQTVGLVFGDCETQTVSLVFGDCDTQTVGLVFGDCETQTVGLVFGDCETQTVGLVFGSSCVPRNRLVSSCGTATRTSSSGSSTSGKQSTNSGTLRRPSSTSSSVVEAPDYESRGPVLDSWLVPWVLFPFPKGGSPQRYESEIGVNNLYDLEIPEDVKEKIEKLTVANQ